MESTTSMKGFLQFSQRRFAEKVERKRTENTKKRESIRRQLSDKVDDAIVSGQISEVWDEL